MTLCSLRTPIGGAVAALVLVGCNRSPFHTDSLVLHRPDALGDRLKASNPPTRQDDRTAATELPTLDESSTLDHYLRYAARNNPGLEAAFQRWKAAVERLPQVRALPDPRFTYGYYISEVETRVGPMQHAFSLSQTLPWLGKLQDREDAAARAANAQFRRFEAERLDLFFVVESAFNELFYLKRSIDIAGDNIELLLQFERVARARYRVAAARHPDIVRIQVELGVVLAAIDLHIAQSTGLLAFPNRSSASAHPGSILVN